MAAILSTRRWVNPMPPGCDHNPNQIQQSWLPYKITFLSSLIFKLSFVTKKKVNNIKMTFIFTFITSILTLSNHRPTIQYTVKTDNYTCSPSVEKQLQIWKKNDPIFQISQCKDRGEIHYKNSNQFLWKDIYSSSEETTEIIVVMKNSYIKYQLPDPC